MHFNLERLRIIKSGPIDDLLIDFINPETKKPLDFCVIGGVNGSGKTTILETIQELISLLLRCPHMQPNFKKNVKYAQLDLLVNDIPFTIYYGIKPVNAKIYEDNFLGYEKRVGSDRFKRLRAGDIISTLHYLTHEEEDKEIKCKDFRNIEHSDEKLPTIIYFPGHRVIEPIKERNQIYKEETVYKLVHKYENIRQFEGSFESYLIWLDYAEKPTFRKIIKFLNELGFKGKQFSIDRKNLKVQIKVRKGEKHGLHELSSGEQNIFIMLTELKRRIDRQSIVLIDEVENSLHPAFQLRLLDGLRKIQKQVPIQIITTTHSKQVFKYVDNICIRSLNEF